MNDQAMADLRAALQNDEGLRARFAEARTEADIVAFAKEVGVVMDVADPSGGVDVSDAELEMVSGGYTFPATDWIYCDNPWTNAWCTLKC